MIPAKPTPDEPRRLAELRLYEVLDTLPEQALDDLTALAAHICGTPIAAISLVDEHRQWFKSKVGLNMSETARDISFCGHAVQQRDLFIVPDATKDVRFVENPLVTGDPHICFYAGAPLVGAENAALGSLCVIDHVPRSLTPDQQQALRVLARQVITHLELHRRMREMVADIAERKKVEEQLIWKTAFFEAQASSAIDGIIIVDSQRKMILQNQRMIDLWHIPQDIAYQEDDKLRLQWVTRQVKNQRQFAKRVADLYDHPEEISCDEIELLDGRYFDRYSAPVIGQDGKYYGRIWSFHDVTEHKQAEKAAIRLTAIVEFSDDAIISKTPEGIIISWNPSAERMFGYTAQEIVGKPMTLLFPPDRLQEEIEILARIAKGERVRHFETVRVRKDGGLIDVSATISPIKDADGKIAGVSKIVRDITERKRADEQIAEQAALLDKTRDAIIVRDLEGKIMFWNKGAEHMYGWTRQEVTGKNIGTFLYTDPKKFEEANRLTTGRGEWHGELQHLTKERGEITIEARWTLIRDAEGKPKSTLAINTDITDRKKIEAQFMRAQRMESIGTLAGGIAHDLNNILTPIMMSIDVLKTMSSDPLAEKILETIELSTKRGADIVRQVLSFARGLEGERVEVQTKHLLRELDSIIKNTFPKNIQLRFSLCDAPWTFLGDPTQVHQILMNLCVNARDAMPNGGSLSVGVENCVLDEQYASMHLQAKAGRYVEINVTDSGTGIPPAILDKIFEPFFTTKDISKGTGLGLSTVAAIAKSHGGFINVYSEPGRGTTFKVYMPAMASPSGERGERSAELSMPRGKGETVLLIDDEASILVITGQTLQAFGYRVLTATDGADALAVYVQHRDEIAVVLTDMMMPVMDGAATIHALMRINPTIKIIAASGLKANDGTAQALNVGTKPFLMKPYTAGTLLKTLRAVLDQS